MNSTETTIRLLEATQLYFEGRRNSKPWSAFFPTDSAAWFLAQGWLPIMRGVG